MAVMGEKKKKILIVDDEFFLAETIRYRLEAEGYEVLYAENGAEALKILSGKPESGHPVDLILMDYLMPVMDGVEATKKIKADPHLKGIPVVFLTALSRQQDRDRSAQSGADDYIIKPFEMSDLLQIIKKWVTQ